MMVNEIVEFIEDGIKAEVEGIFGVFRFALKHWYLVFLAVAVLALSWMAGHKEGMQDQHDEYISMRLLHIPSDPVPENKEGSE